MFVFFEIKVYAKPLSEFYTGVRAMGMGNAFTAIADDKDAIFYNPAGIAFNNKVGFTLSNMKYEGSWDGIKLIREASSFGSELDAKTVETFFGKNLYGSMSLFPSLHLPYFTMGYYVGGQLHFAMRNVSMPQIETTYLFDHGPMAGFGMETHGLSRKHFFRAGLAGKLLTRQGIDRVIPISTLAVADKTYISTLKSGSEKGMGASAGFQYEMPMSGTGNLVLASSWLDIGDTTFGGEGVTNRPPSIRNNLTAGAAWIQYFGNPLRTGSNMKFSLEGRHLAESNRDPRLKLHAGMEVQNSRFSIQAGWNQVGFTAGALINILFFQIRANTYVVENQTIAFQDPERRFSLQIIVDFNLSSQKFNTTRDKYRQYHPRAFQ